MRELGRGSSLFLLYGDSGVGKSRLLQQITKRRLQDQSAKFIDFKNSAADNSTETIKAIADSTKCAGVIIFDHFEAASNKAQHQIFDIWSIDGLDKKLNLIVCVGTTGFDGFCQLAQQYRVDVKSFKLMPCDNAESKAYLQFRLYPEQPFGKLIMAPAVKRLLRRSKGLYSNLIEIAERESESIHIRKAVPAPVRKGPIALVLILTLLLVGAAAAFYYLQSLPDLTELSEPVEVVPEPVKAVSEPVEATSETIEAESTKQEKIVQAVIPEPDPESGQQTEIIPISNLAEESSPEPKIVEIREPEPDSLQSRLQATLDWINNGEINRGTIQIMSIRLDRFDNKAFQAYLGDLSEQGIDVSQIGIFGTRAANQEVYGLIYGAYDSRREASNQIGLLPKALTSNKPITRSAGSIAREIKRYSGN